MNVCSLAFLDTIPIGSLKIAKSAVTIVYHVLIAVPNALNAQAPHT